ncbi:MAG: diaminopimelate epimerase [Phycisphaerae bacterium]
MPLSFTKMHGLGNDYVYVDAFTQPAIQDDAAPKLARELSDRHRGVGGDGLILVTPPQRPGVDARMIMFNADGSRAQMCGNGIRCVAKLVHDRGWSAANPLRIETDAGVLALELAFDAAGKLSTVRVDMGEPILDPKRIPVALGGARVVATLMPLMDKMLSMTCVSMGNPHAVFFAEQLARVPLREWGPQLERHPLFPERMNVHFVQVLTRSRLKMITWERGAGMTQACGTGACAVCVAAVLNRLADRSVSVALPGGELQIEWREDGNHVFMTGPAVELFTGVWAGPELKHA